MKRLFVVALSIAIVAACAGGVLTIAPSPAKDRIATSHPRLWITGEKGVRALRERVAKIPEVRARYETIREWARTAVVEDYSEKGGANFWLISQQANALGLVYLVENRDKEILAKLKGFAEAAGAARPDTWANSRYVKTLAFVYDWCYPDLTPEERSRYVGYMKTIHSRITNSRRHSDYNNHVYLEWGHIIYGGLAIYGDGVDEELAKKMTDWGRSFIFEHGVPAANQVGGEDGAGGWHESAQYHAFFRWEMIQQWEAWRTAAGEDPFAACKGLAGDATWVLHTHRAHDGGPVGAADLQNIYGPATNDGAPRLHWEHGHYMPILASRYKDGVAQYLTVKAIPIANEPYRRFPFVLWYDPSVPITEPKALPTARVYRGLGWATMRSSWERDATWCTFISADYYAGHQHMDQNHFEIHKLGDLAIDACLYGAHQTHFHNSLLIGGEQTYIHNDPRKWYGPIPKGDPLDTGDILAYEDRSPHYTYVCGECGNAYPKGTVEWFSRQLVFFRPDVFVIFDRTRTPQPAPREWLVHSLGPAALGKNEVVITNGEGKLVSRTLLPREVSISQEWITGGVAKMTNNHVRVVPVRNSETSLNFLTVLQLSRRDDPPAVEATLVGESGASVKLGPRTWEVTFGTDGGPTGHIRITEAGTIVCESDLTTGVALNP